MAKGKESDKENSAPADGAEAQRVKAVFTDAICSEYGSFKAGDKAALPRAVFGAWESAGICKEA